MKISPSPELSTTSEANVVAPEMLAMGEVWERVLLTSKGARGVVVPIPSLLLVSSKKKLLLSSESTPFTPAKTTEPCVRAVSIVAPLTWPVQVRFPLALAMVHPVPPDPPAMATSTPPSAWRLRMVAFELMVAEDPKTKVVVDVIERDEAVVKVVRAEAVIVVSDEASVSTLVPESRVNPPAGFIVRFEESVVARVRFVPSLVNWK